VFSIGCKEVPTGLVIVFEDNSKGISTGKKERIFDRRFDDRKGIGLFQVQEIQEITEITLNETGKPGKGAQFEMHVPKQGFRFRTPDTSRNS
jgi:signal transduction histidine kinase